MTDRYYELHITMVGEPAIIQPAVEALGWSFSRIDGDPVEGEGVKCYATTHLHVNNTDQHALGMLNRAASALSAQPPIHVTRQKIELVIHDTRSSKIRLPEPTAQSEGLKELTGRLFAYSHAPDEPEQYRRDMIDAAGIVGSWPPPNDDRNLRQDQTHAWCTEAFGSDHATSLPQRGIRMAEEMIELAQTCHVPQEMLHRLVDYVYARPVGEFRQEMGGAGVTLLCLAGAAGVSADECEAAEVQRVLSKDPLHFRKRNEAKNAAGFDTGAYPTNG